jgi:hypothetical protein
VSQNLKSFAEISYKVILLYFIYLDSSNVHFFKSKKYNKAKMKKNSQTLSKTLIHEEMRFDGTVPSKIEIYKTNKKIKAGYLPWPFVLLGLLFMILVASLIGALVAFNGKNPAIYQINCSQRSCAPGFGLKCINSICQCPSKDYYYSTKCELRKSFGDYCNNQDQCKQGLMCFNGRCACSQERYWTGSMCTNRASHGSSCDRVECLNVVMLTCDSAIKACVCDSSRFWSGKACYKKRRYNDRCVSTEHCVDNQALQCLSGFCKKL